MDEYIKRETAVRAVMAAKIKGYYCWRCGAKMDGESTEGDVELGMGSKE